MKGTGGDLMMAEDLAEKGRFADAIKVMDRILGIPAGADDGARLRAIKASLESTESVADAIAAEMEGKTVLSVKPTRVRLTTDIVSVSSLIEKRMLWLISRCGAEQSEAALLAAAAGAEEITVLLRDPSGARWIALDDQANLLAIVASLLFVMNDYDDLMADLLEAAVRRAPADAKVREFIRASFATCEANLKKNTPAAIAKREQYQAGVDLLRPFVDIVNVAAEIVDTRAFIPFSDVPGAGAAPVPQTVLEMVAKRMADNMKNEREPARVERWTRSTALARKISRAPDPPHLTAGPSPKGS